MDLKILMVDDHDQVRRAMLSLLRHEPDLAVVAEAADGENAVRLATELEPDVVVMDLGLPGIDGIEATRRIVTANPTCAVVIVSIHTERRLVDAALAAGAVAYVAKTAASRKLVTAVRGAASGESFSSQD